MDRSLILSLADDLQFSLTEEEIQNILTDFSWVESIRDQFAQMDTDDVEPMISCSDYSEHALRLDRPQPCLKKEQVLENANKTKEDQILVNQVVRSVCD